MKKNEVLRKNSALKIFCVFMVVFSGWYSYIQAQETKEDGKEASQKRLEVSIRRQLKQLLRNKRTLEEKNKSLQKRLNQALSDKQDFRKRPRDQINSLKAELKEAQSDNTALKKDLQSLKKLNEFQVAGARSHKLSKELNAKDKEKIYRSLGYLYSLDGKLVEAINCYKEALKLNSKDKDVHYNLGYLYAQSGNYKEAVNFYKKSLEGDTSDKDTYYNLAVIYSAYLKDEKKANEYYEKFLQY